MYDPLLEADPWVQEYGARREAKGEAMGEARGETRGIREGIEAVLRRRFPGLYDLAMQRLEHIQDPQALQEVLVSISTAASERKARQYLLTLPETLEAV